jgi:uncharacterized protein YvpB
MSARQGSPSRSLILTAAILIALLVLAACVPEQSLTPSAVPSPTIHLPSPSPTFSPTSTTQPTPLDQATSQPSPIVTENTLPSSVKISGISGHEQTYELGCEASAAVDWAGYYDVLIYESTFQFELPLSDNPDFGFVGSVTTDGWGQIPPDAYGVHAPPIAELLRVYGLPAQAVMGMTLEGVKAELAEGDPIIAWVIGNMVYSSPVKVFDKEGNAVIVAPYEHVVILTGYDETNITYMNNGNFYAVPIDVFLTSWGVLGNMAVIYD